MTWVWSLHPTLSLTKCHLISLHLQEDYFSYIPRMHLVNHVTESRCFPFFLYSSRIRKLSPQVDFHPDVNSKDGIRNHSLQSCLITKSTKLEPALKQQGAGTQTRGLQNSTMQIHQQLTISIDSFPLNGLLAETFGTKEHLGSFEKTECIKSTNYYKLCWLLVQFTSLNTLNG